MFSHGGEKLRIIVFYDVLEVLERVDYFYFWLEWVYLFDTRVTTFSFVLVLSAHRTYALARR